MLLGDRLIVSVELINAKDKTEMWGEQYNRKPADLFQLQSEISKRLPENLTPDSKGQERKNTKVLSWAAHRLTT
jgi:TolB-like protein